MIALSMLASAQSLYAVPAAQWDQAAEVFARGNQCLDAGDPPAAIQAYDVAIELSPLNAGVHYKRALAHQILEHYAEAMAGYNEAIRLDPNMPEAYYYRGTLHKRAGDYTNAIRDFSEAIRLAPTDFWAHNGRADAYRASGNLRAAAEDESEGRRLLRFPTFFSTRELNHIGETGPAQWPPHDLESKVVWVDEDVARIAVGSDDGVFVGLTLVAEHNGKVIATLLIVKCSRDCAFAKITVAKDAHLMVGDVVRVPRTETGNGKDQIKLRDASQGNKLTELGLSRKKPKRGWRGRSQNRGANCWICS